MLFTIFLVLFACNSNYAITGVKLQPTTKSCTFAIEFPEDYYGTERGTQQFTVPAYSGPKVNAQFGAYQFTLEGQTEGIGPELRRKCAGYLAEPEVRTAAK